ncbi:hypothetical protein ACEYX6_03765 [Acinetobacter sp. c2-A9]|uniref:hypothetical protein n=1 Tax=Acinetobacter sp. c2-A9 TaxID=3342802 RepID=UPI0035B754EE
MSYNINATQNNLYVNVTLINQTFKVENNSTLKNRIDSLQELYDQYQSYKELNPSPDKLNDILIKIHGLFITIYKSNDFFKDKNNYAPKLNSFTEEGSFKITILESIYSLIKDISAVNYVDIKIFDAYKELFIKNYNDIFIFENNSHKYLRGDSTFTFNNQVNLYKYLKLKGKVVCHELNNLIEKINIDNQSFWRNFSKKIFLILFIIYQIRIIIAIH